MTTIRKVRDWLVPANLDRATKRLAWIAFTLLAVGSLASLTQTVLIATGVLTIEVTP